MPTKTWATESSRIINAIIDATPRADGEAIADWGKRVKRVLSDRYPYSQRSGFAYQKWCQERKRILYELGIEKNPPKKPTSKARSVLVKVAALEGQCSLFDLGGSQ